MPSGAAGFTGIPAFRAGVFYSIFVGFGINPKQCINGHSSLQGLHGSALGVQICQCTSSDSVGVLYRVQGLPVYILAQPLPRNVNPLSPTMHD